MSVALTKPYRFPPRHAVGGWRLGGALTLVLLLALAQFLWLTHETTHALKRLQQGSDTELVCGTCLALAGVTGAAPAAEFTLTRLPLACLPANTRLPDAPVVLLPRPYLSQGPPALHA